MLKGINAIDFGKRFYDNESCYLYLIEQKWGTVFHAADVGIKSITKAKLIIIVNAVNVDTVKALQPILFFMV